MGRKRIDITGNKYNKLTVIEFSHVAENNHDHYWKFRCDCGNEIVSRRDHVTRGDKRDCGCGWRVTEERGAINLLYAQYRNGAERRSLSFNLDKEQFESLIFSTCTYCGSIPNQIFKNTRSSYDLMYNGIDRIDNAIGYEINNSVTCCKICNRAKHAMGVQEFYSWITQIVIHHTGREHYGHKLDA